MQDLISQTSWSISSEIIIRRAKKLGFRVKVLNATKNFFMLEKNGKRHFFKNVKSELNSAILLNICDDKELTKDLLRQLKLPFPRGIILKKQYHPKKLNLRFPVVAKPAQGSHGIGVLTDIKTVDDLKKALHICFTISPEVIVEEQISGENYRLLIITGKLMSVIKRTPAAVQGDGKSTIAELIKKTNRARADGYTGVLTKIKINADLKNFLQKKNQNLKTIPGSGETVFLDSRANTGLGGNSEMIEKKIVHPTILQAIKKIVTATNAKGIIAVDLITSDLGASLKKTKGAILELETAPSLRSHPETVIDALLKKLC